MSTSADLLLLARLAGGLVVVLTLVYLSARVAKRGRLRRGDSGLRVVDRVGLSRDAHLAVVEISGRTMLLGVTSQSVTMLSALPDDLPYALPDDLPDHAGEERPVPVAPARIALPDFLTEVEVEGEVVDEIGADRARPAPRPSTRRDPVPAGVTLDDYPDLASALRAAGRTTLGPEERMPVGAPRTRAEARRREQALADAERALEEAEAAQLAARQARQKVPQQRTVARPGPTGPTGPTGQASGSVLNPKTWQQGIDALREYTVRRG
jgi:flagellar biogenesis protein FliO